jgi:hypothetical protein
MKMAIYIPLLTAALISWAGIGRAMASAVHADSLLPVSIHLKQGTDHTIASELADIESGYGSGGNHRKTMARLLEMMGPRVNLCTRKVRSRLFGDLAKVAARLRLYPLALRCYYNSCKGEVELPQDSAFYQELSLAGSIPVQPDSIVAGYNDGKEVVFYALLLEVKQPVPGKRKAFTHINNVGHTFITLLKYNRNGSIVSQSFGFYPRKSGILSATPFNPSAASVFKDDSRHEWDEAAGKILSYQQFQDVLRVLTSFAGLRYNLNHRNCTDFGLEAARAGGLAVWSSTGHWPLGHGNNPGSAGQSLLEGRLVGTDAIPGNPGYGPLMIDNLDVAR